MKRHQITAILSAATFMVFDTVAAPVAGPGSYALTRYTIDGGGGTSTGGTFRLSGTIGQPDAGSMTGGGFTLSGGFWFAQGPIQSCPEDITDNGATHLPDGAVNIFDLLLLLGNWNTAGVGAAIAVPTNVVDVFDLLALLTAWGNCT